MIGTAYASLPELKIRLGISDSNDDTRLTEALSVASDSVERFTRRQFNDAGAASARSYRPVHRSLAIVDDFHTGLLVKTDEDDDGTYEVTWDTADYELEPADGVVDGDTGWPWWRIRAVETKTFPRLRRRSVQVTAQWGWAAVPAPVKEATLVLAEDLWKLADTPFGVGGFGDFGRIKARQNPHVAMLLAPFRRDAVRVG